MSHKTISFTTKDGKKHYIQKVRTPKLSYTKLDRQLVGEYRMYDDTGQIRLRAHYSNGILHGNYIEYDEKGKVIVNKRYFAGVEIEEV